jgi:hypothetical protein
MPHFPSEKILDLTFSGLQIGVGFYDKEGRMISCNEEFQKLKSGFLLDDGQLLKVIKQGKADKMLLAGTAETVLESYIAPCRDENGKITQYVYRLSNVSNIYAPSREKALEEIFLDNVSHEIRTPLNAIIGFNDILNGVAGLHMEEDEKLMIKEHIHKNSDRLLTVVSDILDLSKMQKGCLQLHKTVVSLMEICCRARDSVKNEVQPGVKLAHEYPTTLQDTFIYTDGKRLEQLLRNFLINACQHTSSGSVTLKVKTFEDEETDREMLQLRVDDTGEGVPQDQFDLLFKPFRKVDTKSEGLGVGLTVCKEIARMLNGKVYMDKTYEDGSSFVFEMPFEAI